MESLNDQMERVEAQEMISRFRSKRVSIDTLLSMVKQIDVNLRCMQLVYSFQRWKEKKALKNKEIILIEIPNYPEISVTNLYEDAMKNEEVVIYLPSKKQLSPERNFFFGVLGTIKEEYLRVIKEEAHKKRYSISPKDQKKQGKLISETLLAELKNHPYLSRKPGTGIYLMKENAKVHRERKSQTIHQVSKRLYNVVQKPDEINIDAGAGTKRRNMDPSQAPEEEKKEKPNPFKSSFDV